MSDDTEVKQLSFMQAITFIESALGDKKMAIGKDFYVQFKQNEEAFDHMLVADEEVSTEKAKVTGNDAKVIKLLKAMKQDARFTDDQEAVLDRLINLWEQGEVPAKIAKDIVKCSKLASDVLELYYEIMKLVPETYFVTKEQTMSIVDGDKQVVLSCYLKCGGSEK